VQQLVALKLKQQRAIEKAKKRWFQMDAAREIDKLTASFWACFYPVRRPSGSWAPTLGPLLQLAAQPSGDWRFGSITTRATKADGCSRLLRLN